MVASLGAGLGATAWADNDPNAQKAQVDASLASAGADLEGATAQTSAVRARYAATLVRVDAAAQAQAQATAQGRVAAARSAQDAASAAVSTARAALAAAQADVVAAQQDFETRTAAVAAFARAAYETGPSASVGAIVTATDIADLADRAVTIRNAGVEEQQQVAALAGLHAVVVGRQAQATVVQGQLAAAQAAAADSVARAQAASDDADAAAAALVTAKADQASQLTAATAAQVQDQNAYDELQAESDQLGALLRARAASQAQAAASTAAAAKAPATRAATTPAKTVPAPAAPSAAAPVSSSGLLWPTAGPVTSPFGYRTSPTTGEPQTFHAGVDIGAPSGQNIMAAQSGTVVYAGEEQGYGNYTCIDHGSGFATCYAHQSFIGVSVGEVVTRGEVIGRVGSTGNSTGPHLHFETRVNGTPVDPMNYF